MAELTSKQRDKMPASKFGLPGDHAYPMPDKEHAGLAKGRADEELKAGKLFAVGPRHNRGQGESGSGAQGLIQSLKGRC